MGGNPHASLLMGTNAHGAVASEVRNVVDKTVVREFQAVLMSLHAYFFNSPDDLRAKAFVDHMLSPSKTPIEETILQTYAKYMADHLVKPTLAGMKLLVYVLEGHSDGKHLPNGAAQRRRDARMKEYQEAKDGVEGADYRKCIGVPDCAVTAVIAEVNSRTTKCVVSFVVPPGEADPFLAEMSKDPETVVCVDSNDGDIGTLFFHPKDQAILHYDCAWEVPPVGSTSKRVTLHSKITTPAQLFSMKTISISKTKEIQIDFSKWDKLKMVAFCLAVSTNGDYMKGMYNSCFCIFIVNGTYVPT